MTRDEQLEKRYEQLRRLGERVKEERLKAKLSQKKLARELDTVEFTVTRDMISRAENGQRASRNLVKAYNKFFGLRLRTPIQITINPAVAAANRRRKGEKKPRRIKSQSQSPEECDRSHHAA